VYPEKSVMFVLFLKGTATPEMYTLHIVGVVGCV